MTVWYIYIIIIRGRDKKKIIVFIYNDIMIITSGSPSPPPLQEFLKETASTASPAYVPAADGLTLSRRTHPQSALSSKRSRVKELTTPADDD